MECRDTTQILQSPGQPLNGEPQQSGGWETVALQRGGHRAHESGTPQTGAREPGTLQAERASQGPRRLERASRGPRRLECVSRGPRRPERTSRGRRRWAVRAGALPGHTLCPRWALPAFAGPLTWSLKSIAAQGTRGCFYPPPPFYRCGNWGTRG